MKNKKFKFKHYYREYFDKIYRYIYFRVGRDKDLAEDMTSDVMLKAYEHFDSFDPLQSFSTWIYSIAHNYLVDFYKKKKIHEVNLEYGMNAGVEMSYGDDIDVENSIDLVKEHLEKLPDLQKNVVIMKYFEDMKTKEIAEVIGITEGNVRVALHRAVSVLKKHLKFI